MAYHVRGVFLPDEQERDAWIREGRLTFEPPSPGTQVETLAAGGWVIPGLVDAHCHVGIAPWGHVTSEDDQAAQAIKDRDAGALLLRDVGSPVDTTSLQERDDLPRLIRAGRHIARTRRYIRDQAVEVEPEQLVAEVERQASRADGWVKIAGDWIDRDLGDLAPTFPDDAMAAAVGRAHELGARVAVHVFGEEALQQALRAGVDSIEHGTGLDEESADVASRAGTALVPTLVNVDQFHDIARAALARFPQYAQHMRALHATARDRVRTAWEAGVPVFVGTDAGGTLPHGLVCHEILALVGAGLPLSYVLAQASWKGREWLGLPGLVEGAPADLVVYDRDPREHVATVFDPRRIVLKGIPVL